MMSMTEGVVLLILEPQVDHQHSQGSVSKKKDKKSSKTIGDRWEVVQKLEKALEVLQDPLDLSIEYVRGENKEGELAIFCKLIWRRTIPSSPAEGGMC
jgi:hypothetical protein